jgi:hypothetical protein
MAMRAMSDRVNRALSPIDVVMVQKRLQPRTQVAEALRG